jgi:transposase
MSSAGSGGPGPSEALARLAGVAPSTCQSGKVKPVTFRWSADSQLRDAPCHFAGDSRHDNPWAADLYARARARGHDHPHAVRILARAWANIIWRCRQDNVAYHPDRHNALQRVLNENTPQAA